MSFLDPKERILDITLTEEGRKKLSQGKLQVKYYRFFDDEVDYQISFNAIEAAAIAPTGSTPSNAVIFGDGLDVVYFGTDIVIFGT